MLTLVAGIGDYVLQSLNLNSFFNSFTCVCLRVFITDFYQAI